MAKNGLTFLWAVSLLWASVGFQVEQHFCLGMLVSESFYQPSQGCAMVAGETSCPKDLENLQAPNCCENQQLYIPPVAAESAHGQDPAPISSAPLFLKSALAPPLLPSRGDNAQWSAFTPPPPALKNPTRQALIQRFTI